MTTTTYKHCKELIEPCKDNIQILARRQKSTAFAAKNARTHSKRKNSENSYAEPIRGEYVCTKITGS